MYKKKSGEPINVGCAVYTVLTGKTKMFVLFFYGRRLKIDFHRRRKIQKRYWNL